jgi:hypothetical protein
MTTIPTNILPTDLNSLLYHLKSALGETTEAERLFHRFFT